MTDIRKKIVRVIAVDKRYIKEPYPAIAVYDSSKNTYLTGQHIDPNIPITRNNLTLDEMIGKKIVSEEKAKRFPYILNPEQTIPIIHMEKLDITKDDNGKAINPNAWTKYVFIMGYCSFVAATKKEVRPGTDFFYVEDLEAEADDEVKTSDLIYEAQKCIREKTSIRNLKDVALILNYKIKNFSIPIETMSEIRIKKELIDVCNTSPKEVISCFNEDAKEDLYIFKLVKHGILELKNGAYYDGNTIVGTSVDNVKIYMKSPNPENTKYVSKWGKLLLEKEGKIPKSFENNNEQPQSPLPTSSTTSIQFDRMIFDEMKEYAGKKKHYPGAEWKELDESGLRKYLVEKQEVKK